MTATAMSTYDRRAYPLLAAVLGKKRGLTPKQEQERGAREARDVYSIRLEQAPSGKWVAVALHNGKVVDQYTHEGSGVVALGRVSKRIRRLLETGRGLIGGRGGAGGESQW